jgi:hypothetical protein
MTTYADYRHLMYGPEPVNGGSATGLRPLKR